jgi:MFS family permease
MGAFVHPLLALILTEKVGLTTDRAGLYVTTLSILSIPSLILGGKLVDTIGRKKVIIISQGLGAAVIIICGFIKPSINLTYALMFSSLLYSLSSPAYDAMLADLTTTNNRKASYSLLYMGWNLGYALGPFIGGMLYKNLLLLVFIGDGITTLISLILVSLFVGETIHKEEEKKEEDRGELEKKVEGSVLSVLFRRPILPLFAMILFCVEFAYSQWGFTLPLQMGQIFKDNGAAYYGMLASFNGLIVIILTPLISKATHHIKPLIVISLGSLGYALAFGMLSFSKILALFFISIFIMTIGEIMISINASTFIANHTPASHRGRISSILPMIIGSGYTLGPLIMGKFIAVSSIETAWLFIGALGFFSAFLMYMLKKIDKDDTK